MNVLPEMVIGKNTVAQTTALEENNMLPQVNQEIVPQLNETTITSRDIASLTNKEHRHVLRDIEIALEESAKGYAQFWTHPQNGQKYKEYVLPKNIALGIVSGYSFELRMKIINRLNELENEKIPSRHYQLPETFAEALRLAADLSDENIKLNQTIKAKDEVILAVADLNIKAGEVSIGDFSKNLAIENLGRNNLFDWLKARGFLMMNTEPYQQYVERGYFVRKPSDKRINGEVKYTTMLTPKGTVWLTKILRAEYNLDEAKSA
jgi:phage antirepressor YoqD-like protein